MTISLKRSTPNTKRGICVAITPIIYVATTDKIMSATRLMYFNKFVNLLFILK